MLWSGSMASTSGSPPTRNRPVGCRSGRESTTSWALPSQATNARVLAGSRISPWSWSQPGTAAGFVERDELVGAGGGDEYPVQAGHDDHAVHAGKAGGDAHDSSSGGVDLQQSAGAELGEEQPVRGRVDVGVVVPGRRRRQGQL